MRSTRHLSWILPVLVLSCGAKKPKKKSDVPTGPIVGWHTEEGWTGSCYYPPDFATMGGGERRIVRQEALEAVMSQWKGARDDGISFDPVHIENVETVLLGHPDKIEVLVAENLTHCQAAVKGGGTTAWADWLVGQPRKLMEGECRRPLDSTMFWYLDIGTDWQFAAGVCDENVVKITATATDEYRVDDKGPWINALGDPKKPATGPDYPCNIEGCLAGQLVLRFRGDSGAQVIKPIGLELVFDPPEHGVIDVMINDTSYFNNEFRLVGGIQHHTSVTYEPVE